MITFLAIIHIVGCLALIGLVMIQDSKGGGVFTAQSTSNSVLGATGATTLAQTMTKVLGAFFAATCIGLSLMASHAEKSVIDTAVPAAASAPATTAAPATDKATAAPAESAPAGKTAPAQNEKK